MTAHLGEGICCYGVIAKNYNVLGGLQVLLYANPFRSVPKDEIFFEFFLVNVPMLFGHFVTH